MWIENGLGPSPPTQTGQAVLPHPAFQFMVWMDWLRHSTPGFGRVAPAAQAFRLAHLFRRRSTVGSPRHPRPGSPEQPSAQPCGTTRPLVRWGFHVVQHHVPVPLRSTVVTRFGATTRTLTPTGPFTTGRGSLIHVTRTSDHSVSNHRRFSTRRVPLPQRWQHYFVRASPFRSQARQNRRPNRVHLSLCVETCYGLIVHFQLLPTRGYGPGAVTFSYWPYSVGQVRDSHPAVQVRSQAHERGRSPSAAGGTGGRSRAFPKRLGHRKCCDRRPVALRRGQARCAPRPPRPRVDSHFELPESRR